MSRRTRAVKRAVLPDPVYGSETVTKFINNLMSDGKKSIAEGIFYDAMTVIEERAGAPAEAVFKTALNNAKPAPVRLRSAATITDVSNTTRCIIAYITSYRRFFQRAWSALPPSASFGFCAARSGLSP